MTEQKRFNSLYKEYPRNLVRKSMGITTARYNKLLEIAMKDEKIKAARNEIDKSLRKARELVPYSRNEDDYGLKKFENKKMITKDGLLIFIGNAPIRKHKNKLSEIVKEYVVTMLDNNQPLKFRTL